MKTNSGDSNKNLLIFIISLITIFLLFIGLLFTFIGIFFNYQITVKDSKRNEQKQIMAENIKIIQDWVASKKQEVATFSTDYRVKTMKNDEINQALGEFVKQNSSFELICILGQDGKSVACSDGRVSDQSSRAFFKQSLSGMPFITEPMISKNTRKIVLGLSFPIISNKSVIGVIYALVPIENLTTSFAYTTPSASGEIYIIDSNGYLITPSRFEDDLKIIGLIKNSSVLELHIDSYAEKQIQNGVNGTSEYRNYLGNPVLGTYVRLSEPDWGLILEQNTDEAYMKIRSASFMLLVSIIILILITLILIFIATIQFKFKGKDKNNKKFTIA